MGGVQPFLQTQVALSASQTPTSAPKFTSILKCKRNIQAPHGKGINAMPDIETIC